MTNRKQPSTGFNTLLAGGLMVALIALMVDVQTRRFPSSNAADFSECAGDIQGHVTLSEEHLANVLSISERDSKDKVRAILSEPYCVLPSVEVRSGVQADREVYPLAFDEHAWLVLLFEGDEYAGYHIRTQ